MLVWKVQLGKLLEVQFRRFIVGARGFFNGLESAKMDAMVVYSYTRFPSLFPFVPRHASITRSVVDIDLLPTSIFLGRDYAQILTPIVKSVTVDMVHNVSLWGKSYDGMMQAKKARGISLSIAAHEVNAPFVLVQFIIHVVVNNCFVALREFDFFSHLAVPFIGRLSDGSISQEVAL